MTYTLLGELAGEIGKRLELRLWWLQGHTLNFQPSYALLSLTLMLGHNKWTFLFFIINLSLLIVSLLVVEPGLFCARAQSMILPGVALVFLSDKDLHPSGQVSCSSCIIFLRTFCIRIEDRWLLSLASSWKEECLIFGRFNWYRGCSSKIYLLWLAKWIFWVMNLNFVTCLCL